MPKEEDKLTERLKRYAKVSTQITGLAARLAGQQYFGVDIDRVAHAADLTAALGNLKGPLMKVAQLLSTIPDMLPPEYAEELAQLQAQAPPMGWPFVKRRMRTELGENWQEHFAEFDNKAAAAASLGQVHKAIDHKGHQLACKLQYPNMASVVEADLHQLKLLLKLYGTYDKAIQSDDLYQEVSDRLREELDYILEAKHTQLYTYMLAKEKNIHVPEILPKLSTKRLLTMTWLEGEPLMEVKNRSLADRNQIAINMFRAWYIPFYQYGIIHGDPHLGNYSIRQDNSVNLLDFGCIRIFEVKFVQGVIDLYYALLNNDEELATHAYRSWGFHGINKELLDVLNQWAHFLYAPLMEDRVRPIEETYSGTYGRTVAAKVHEELRRIGGVKPPREFVLMDRAAVGLGSVFMHLRAEINWYQQFQELIANFNQKKLASQQQKALSLAGLKGHQKN